MCPKSGCVGVQKREFMKKVGKHSLGRLAASLSLVYTLQTSNMPSVMLLQGATPYPSLATSCLFVSIVNCSLEAQHLIRVLLLCVFLLTDGQLLPKGLSPYSRSIAPVSLLLYPLLSLSLLISLPACFTFHSRYI